MAKHVTLLQIGRLFDSIASATQQSSILSSTRAGGMLERTAGCLESGSLRRLIPGPKLAGSRRMLHSGFWNHGTTELEMSPLWQALLQVSMAKDATPDECTRDSAPSSSTGYLDFLYPIGALSALHQYSSWAMHGLERRRLRSAFGGGGRRAYSNVATEERPPEDFVEATRQIDTTPPNGSSDEVVQPDDLEIVRQLLDEKDTRKASAIYKRYRERPDRSKIPEDILKRMGAVFCDAQDVAGQEMILSDWKSSMGDPRPATYRLLMMAAARRGDADKVHELWTEYQILMHKLGIRITKNDDFNPLLDVHSKRGELSKCLAVFDLIKRRKKSNNRPSITHHNMLLNAYGRVGDVEGATSLYGEMLDANKYDEYTVGTMMGILTKRGDYEGALEIFDSLETLHIRPTTAMLDCVVYSHIGKGDPRTAERICKETLHKLLDRPKTRMWNYLLVYYADRRDMKNVFRIHKEMADANIPYDGATYAALMMALVVGGQPMKAFQIMTKVMPAAGMRPSEFHYAVVMGGFIHTKEYSYAINLHQRMMKDKYEDMIRPGMSTNLQAFKAAMAIDQKFLEGAAPEELSKMAHDYYFQALTEADAQDMVSPVLKSVPGGVAQDVALKLAGFDHYIFIAGQNRAFERATELANIALSRIPDGRMLDVPLKFCSALMAAQRKSQDHDGLQKTWKLAFDVAKYQGRHTSKRMSPVTEKYRYSLGKVLSYLILSYNSQGKVEELKAVVEEVEEAGFSLDSDNWNLYVQGLTEHHHYMEAFQLCEKNLMPGWTGWSKVRQMLPRRNRLSQVQRRLKDDPRYLRPIFHTLLYLTKAYLELEASVLEGGAALKRFELLERSCPKTLYAIRSLRREEDDLERNVLGGDSQ